MQKILIIDSSVDFTGAFKAALRQAEILNEQYSFIFIVPTGSNTANILKQKGFAVYELPLLEIGRSFKKLLFYIPRLFKNYLQIKNIVSKEQVSIIQVNDFYNLLGATTKFFGYKGRLITYVRLLPASLPKPLFRFWVGVAQKYSNYIVAVSDAVKNQLPASDKTILIYDPVSFTENHPIKIIDKNHTEVKLLYLANFTRGKGQEHAMSAFVNSYKHNPTLRLIFAGGDFGLEKNKAFRQELIATAKANSLDKVTSFHDFVQDVEELIKSADIVLNFSEAESFSMTVAEASFYGLPVIATRCGGPEEIIINGENGLLVDKGAINQMESAILTLAASSSTREKMGLTARLQVRTKFSVTQFKNQFQKMLLS